MNQRNRISRRIVSDFGLLALAGLALASSACMVGPKYQRASVPTPPAYKESPPESFKEAREWKEAQPSDGAVRGKWWEIYHDPQLNALEEQVSISNQNLLAAEAQFRAAKDAVRIARSSLFPTVTGSPSIVNSQHFRDARRVLTPACAQPYTVPVDLSYQADVWGSIRHSVGLAGRDRPGQRRPVGKRTPVFIKRNSRKTIFNCMARMARRICWNAR